MLRLLKFEIQKKWKMSVGALAAYFIVYIGFYLKFKSDGYVELDEFGLQLVFFVVLAVALMIFSMIGAVNNLRLEAKNSTRDLYFSIPLTAYSKIGSKVIISLVEVFGAATIGIISAGKAIGALTKTDWLTELIKESIDLSTLDWIYLFADQIIGGAITLLIVYLSFALFRTFFSQVKLGWLITIIIYIGLNIAYRVALGNILGGVDLTDSSKFIILGGFVIFAAGLFALIGYLFENRVSFD